MPRPPLQLTNLQRRRYHSTLEVKIEDCVTVGDLKKSISIQQNLSVIALLYRGVLLDDARQLEKLLPDLLIGPPRFAIHTRVRPRAIQGGVSVNILSLNRKTFQVMLHSLDMTVLELKQAIQGYEGISLDQIVLTYAGKQLNKDFSTLRQCALQPGCTVHLVGRLRGGGGGALPEFLHPVGFVNMENTSLLRKIRLSTKDAPEWRVSEEGLSMEGKCWNDECEAYGEPVICNLQFTAFNLLMDEIHCPLCKETIRAVTCGFRKCLWMFEGRKTGMGSVDVASQWMVAGRNYERFDEDADRATAEWSSLIITTKKLPSISNMKAFHGNGECPICHEDFKASSVQCTLKCQHAFHRECVMAWRVRGNTTCPMCRNSLEWSQTGCLPQKTPACARDDVHITFGARSFHSVQHKCSR